VGAFGGGGGGGFGGQPGLLRLFNGELGGEISWLLPLAAAALVAGLWARRRAPRTDLARAGYVLWGLWLLTHAVVFSFASGIFHPYYAVVMAPAVAALVGAGVVELWRLHSRSLVGAVIGAIALPVTAWWGSQLLARTPEFAPGLGAVELSLAVVAAVLLLAAAAFRWRGRLPAVALGVGLVAVLLGPSAYAVATVGRAEQGAIPSSGPATAAAFGPAGVGRALGGRPLPSGGFGGDTSPALLRYLEQHQGGATWLVATSSANSADSIELATGRPVLAMGGFSGSDPAMTVSKLQQLVSSGQLRYVLVGGGGPGRSGPAAPSGTGSAPAGAGQAFRGGPPASAGFPGTSSSTQSVAAWVTQHCKAVNYSGSGSTSASVLYDCSTATTSG
jgi:4-amino-4-deoxy-L-arabinose transferase-like glycosyltransferase